MTLGTILLIVLILMLIGAIPSWPHSRSWGYGPSGGLGLVVIVIVVVRGGRHGCAVQVKGSIQPVGDPDERDRVLLAPVRLALGFHALHDPPARDRAVGAHVVGRG